MIPWKSVTGPSRALRAKEFYRALDMKGLGHGNVLKWIIMNKEFLLHDLA
jgi:hypothetical protein